MLLRPNSGNTLKYGCLLTKRWLTILKLLYSVEDMKIKIGQEQYRKALEERIDKIPMKTTGTSVLWHTLTMASPHYQIDY